MKLFVDFKSDVVHIRPVSRFLQEFTSRNLDRVLASHRIWKNKSLAAGFGFAMVMGALAIIFGHLLKLKQ